MREVLLGHSTYRFVRSRRITLACTALLGALLSEAYAQNRTILRVNPRISTRQLLQPITVRNLQFSRVMLDATVFQRALSAQNVIRLNLDEMPARIDAEQAAVRAGLDVTARLVNAPDLRADVARSTLQLPEGLTVPATVRLRDGRTQEVTLLGRDTVARSVAEAEARADMNRLTILRSFGLTDAMVVENIQKLAAPAPTPPQPKPSQPGQELGDGFNKNPADGACRFTPTNPLFTQMKGGNIGTITSIKNQGSRGTCMAFGFVSALESQIARRSKMMVNLSEQYAYYWLRGDDGVLGDGAGWNDYDDIIAQKRMIPTEIRWNYNPSYARQVLPGGKQPVTQFKNSCTNYKNQACSDTTAQAQLMCQGSTNNCVWKPEWEIQENAAFNFRPTAGQEVWFGLAKMPFSTAEAQRAYRRLALRKMLNDGDQLILGFGVDSAFDSIGTNGAPKLSLMGQNPRGGHAVHLIGYVDTGTVTLSGVKYAGQNAGSLTFPTGVWIIKNSWSCGFGDGGYAYLPDAYLDQQTNGVYRLQNNAVDSDLAKF